MVRYFLRSAFRSFTLNSSSRDSLNKAQNLFDEKHRHEEGQRTISKNKERFGLLVADAYYLRSLIAAVEGQTKEALYFGRISLKCAQKSWALLEKRLGKSNQKHRKGEDENVDHNLVQSMSDLAVSEHRKTDSKGGDQTVSIGAAFWKLVPRLFRGYVHLSQLSSYNGLLPEVKYYLSQAREISETARANSLIGQSSALLGNSLMCGGELEEGFKNLQEAEDLLASVPHDLQYARLQLSLAKAHAEHGYGHSEPSPLAIAERTINNLTVKKFLDELTHQYRTPGDLDSQLRVLTLDEKKPDRQARTKARQANSKVKSARAKEAQDGTQIMPKAIPAAEVVVLDRFKSEILQGRVLAAIFQDDLDLAVSLLDEGASLSSDQDDIVLRALSSSQVRLRQGIEQLVSNPVFCVLPESTISYPSVKGGSERQEQKASPVKPQPGSRTALSKNQRAKPIATKSRPRSPSLCKTEFNLLDSAHNSLREVHKLAKTSGKTSTMHGITCVLGKILLLLSATSSYSMNRPVSSTFMAYILGLSDLPKLECNLS